MNNDQYMFNDPLEAEPYNVTEGVSEGHSRASLAQQMPSSYVPILAELQIGGGCIVKYGTSHFVLWMLGMSLNYTGWLKSEDGPALSVNKYFVNPDFIPKTWMKRDPGPCRSISAIVYDGRVEYWEYDITRNPETVIGSLVYENFKPNPIMKMDWGFSRSWMGLDYGDPRWLMQRFARYPRVEKIILIPDETDSGDGPLYPPSVPSLNSVEPSLREHIHSTSPLAKPSPLADLANNPIALLAAFSTYHFQSLVNEKFPFNAGETVRERIYRKAFKDMPPYTEEELRGGQGVGWDELHSPSVNIGEPTLTEIKETEGAFKYPCEICGATIICDHGEVGLYGRDDDKVKVITCVNCDKEVNLVHAIPRNSYFTCSACLGHVMCKKCERTCAELPCNSGRFFCVDCGYQDLIND